jgi:isopropylmalate/homocitrate/citramalate synthase
MEPDRFGIHFHGQGQQVIEKIQAVLLRGVPNVETFLRGFGGCLAAKREVQENLSNAPTENVVERQHQEGYQTGIKLELLHRARNYLSFEIGEMNSKPGRLSRTA